MSINIKYDTYSNRRARVYVKRNGNVPKTEREILEASIAWGVTPSWYRKAMGIK